MRKLEQLLERYQSNVFPAMLDHLGTHLGVSPDSLRRLGLGWAPIVSFKKRISFGGWWVIPERDADGHVTGLGLRNATDDKTSYPGSRHGLIYEVNPDHSQGDRYVEPGRWTRCFENGIRCPICQHEKSDGCSVGGDPSDPAVVNCVRTPSPRRAGMGYLHILKPRGQSSQVSALPPHESPVIVVEGMTDAAAAMDLGFVAVGRPSNLACMDVLCDLVRGRPVLIVGENDRKVDPRTGQERTPGIDGMIAAFQVIRRVCADVRMVLPPAHIKDLRAWKVKSKLTRDQFLAYVDAHAKEHAAQTVIEDERPLTIARAYLDSEHRMAGRYVIRRWMNGWYRYAGSKYVPVENEAFEAPLYRWAHDKVVQSTNPLNGATNLVPLVANTAFVSNVTKAIMSETLISDLRLPCWINGAKGPDPANLIVFANGILDVAAFLAGEPESTYWLESTPDLFTTAALPFSFDPTAACPTWRRFLRASLGDDPAKIWLLREWFGYCLTPDTSMQKLLFLRGPSAAGKSLILNVLCHLVGEEQAASTSFADLSGPFGIQSLIGKLVCVLPDARTPRHGDNMRGLELLLNIVGNDPVQINRKFKDPLERHRLIARISIASNEFLDVPDYAGAMLRRLNILEFSRSFVGREDFSLEEKLLREVPGIAVWALAGLKRLRERGRFTVPDSSREALMEWRTSTSPLSAFLEECCDQDAQGEVLKQELFDAWSIWSMERGIRPITKSRFFERVRSNAPFATSETYERGGHKRSVYKGLCLKPWAARKLTGRPQ